MTDKLKKLFDHAAGFATAAFEAQGELTAMWIAQDAKGGITPIMTPFDEEDTKDAVAAAVRQIFKDIGAVRCAFISETWMMASGADGKLPKDYKMGDPIVEHPQRQEAVVIVAEDNVGASMMGIYPILRHGPKPTLGPLDLKGATVGHGQGRFTDMLLP